MRLFYENRPGSTGCTLGTTLVEEDRVIAMYHGTEVGNMIATSSDHLLLNWEKLNNSAVIPLNDSSRFSDGKNTLYSVFETYKTISYKY